MYGLDRKLEINNVYKYKHMICENIIFGWMHQQQIKLLLNTFFKLLNKMSIQLIKKYYKNLVKGFRPICRFPCTLSSSSYCAVRCTVLSEGLYSNNAEKYYLHTYLHCLQFLYHFRCTVHVFDPCTSIAGKIHWLNAFLFTHVKQIFWRYIL